MAAIKIVKAVTKRGRKRRRGRGIGSAQEKKEALDKGFIKKDAKGRALKDKQGNTKPDVAALRNAKKSEKKLAKKRTRAVKKGTALPVGTVEMVDVGTKTSKKPLPSLSTEERMRQAAANISGRRGAEIRRLTGEQRGVAREGMGAPAEQRRASLTYSPTDPRNVGEGVNTALLSKAEVEPSLRKYSRARLRELMKAGTVKIVRRGTYPDGSPRHIVVSTGRMAPPRGMVAEAMGLKGVLPSEQELVEKGGFQIRKRGGTVRRRTGGAIGVGVALRGFGKGYKKRG